MGGGPPGFPRDFPCPVVLGVRLGRGDGFGYAAVTLSGGPFQTSSPTIAFCHSHVRRPTTPEGNAFRFRLFPVRSPLLRESRLLSSPRGTKMFQFPRCALPEAMDSPPGYRPIPGGGLPHSGIPGSTPAYGSPGRIAVCRALHRLLAPRHPPCALSSLTHSTNPRAIRFSRCNLEGRFPQNESSAHRCGRNSLERR